MADSSRVGRPARGALTVISPADLAHSSEDQKLAEVVARDIEQEIIDAGWPVGDVLGSEAELIDRLRVSRAVFREAVRLMEHHGVARMRRGPGGGLVVTAPQGESITQSMALFLNYRHVTLHDLHEARVTVELNCVQLAAERINESGIARLRDAIADEASGLVVQPTAQAHEIHRLIAELSGNAAMALFVEALTKLTFQRQRQERRDVEEQLAVAENVHHAHAAIVEAIIVGDTALARHRMSRHLDALTPWLRAS